MRTAPLKLVSIAGIAVLVFLIIPIAIVLLIIGLPDKPVHAEGSDVSEE
jgi:hypothetical protein